MRHTSARITDMQRWREVHPQPAASICSRVIEAEVRTAVVGGRRSLRVERGELSLHGWHYVIEDGEVHVFDVKSGGFVPASRSEHSGTGPFADMPCDNAIFNEIDAAHWQPGRA
jgi:carbonic anhydrase